MNVWMFVNTQWSILNYREGSGTEARSSYSPLF